MKNLADFKRFLQENLNNSKVLISSKVRNPEGLVVKESIGAPIGHVQSNSFALNRVNGLSWLEYGKAGEWTFEKGKATRNYSGGGSIELTIHTES